MNNNALCKNDISLMSKRYGKTSFQQTIMLSENNKKKAILTDLHDISEEFVKFAEKEGLDYLK